MKEKIKAIIKRYEIGFDKWGVILFLAVILPFLVWEMEPIDNDILDLPSITPVLDKFIIAFQIISVGSFLMFRNIDGRKPIKKSRKIAIGITFALYYIGWILYFTGCTRTITVLLMITLMPIVTLLLFSSARKNYLAYCTLLVFLIFIISFVIINFLMRT